MAFGLVLLIVVVALGVALLAIAGSVIGIYNHLVMQRNRTKNAYAQIDVQLKRRYDLIPNLVETARGYLTHEKQTLEAVVQARATAVNACQKASMDPGDAASIQGVSAAEGVFQGALGRLLAVVEAYPDLKANQNMMQLTEELTSTENKVAFARQAYNDAVLSYNTARETFPNNLLANFFGFQPGQLFEITQPGEREAPRVSFS